MRATILEFSPDIDMAVTEGRFNKLADRVDAIGERIARVEGADPSRAARRGKWTDWLPIGAPAVALIAVVVTVGIHLDNKVGAAQKDTHGLSEQLIKTNNAVKALADAQSDATKQLVKDLLASAGTELPQKPEIAIRAVRAANSLITNMREQKRPADPQYFEGTVSILNRLAAKANSRPVAEAVHSSRIILAEYSSALQSPPPPYASFVFGVMEHAVLIRGGKDQVYEHVRWDFRRVTGTAIVLKEKPTNVMFKESVIEGGTQTLDGIRWHSVTFIGSHISYQGGYTELENVHFVNCTFDAPQSPQGQHFLEMATLNLPKFVG